MKRLNDIFAASILSIVGCTSGTVPSDSGPLVMDGGVDAQADRCTTENETRCTFSSWERCQGGSWVTQQACPTACDATLGCVDCVPAQRRTCIGGHARACTSEGLIGGVLEMCAAENPCVDGYCGGCAADTDLIYLLDGGAHLFSYDPRTNELVDKGAINCPVMTERASPYSMSVDRRGRAWVLYDSGELFWVDVADTTCTPTGFMPDQLGFHTFGMGFVSDSPGGNEVLYIAGGPQIANARMNTKLGIIDQSTLRVREVAPLTVLDSFYPELSGDGAGALYGYFPSAMTFPSRVSTIRRETARIGPTWDAVQVDTGAAINAWAFARWGGSFYVFVGIGSIPTPPLGTEFYRLDPETGELTLVNYDRHIFVGAGVSTCAPLLI
jgi:hypothetical protein